MTLSLDSSVTVLSHADGKKIEERGYKDGKSEGKQVLFFPSGKKKVTGSWTDGKKEGWWQRWDEDGKLKEKARYAKGKVVEKRNLAHIKHLRD